MSHITKKYKLVYVTVNRNGMIWRQPLLADKMKSPMATFEVDEAEGTVTVTTEPSEHTQMKDDGAEEVG